MIFCPIQSRTAPGLALIFAVAAATAIGQGAAPDETATGKVSAEQIRAWVGDLDSGSFTLRETATQRLIEAGLPAIEPVVNAVTEGELEVVARGVHVLRELALSSELPAQDAALAALEKLAAARTTPAGRRAGKALSTLGAIRQQRALAELQSLGAKVYTPPLQIGRLIAYGILTVEIDETFKGGQPKLALLRWLPDVRQVAFVGPQVTDDWLTHLGTMENLQSIVIKRANVRGKGLVHLKNLRDLRQLCVVYSPIDDRSVDHLSALKSATALRLFGTEMTDAGAERLEKAMEGVKIDYRRGAFLGVGCQTLAAGCGVSTVHPGSAAEKAGVKTGDVVVKYGDRKVANFDALTALIAKNRPGDTIRLEIRRGSETISKEVKLGEWE